MASDSNNFYIASLRHLHPDVLLEVFELLRPNHQLQPLSLTCKWIRDACMPILFRDCVVWSYAFDKSETPVFLPQSIWPYVRTLMFEGSFARPDLIPEYFGPDSSPAWLIELARLRALARSFSQFVKHALLSMYNLHVVSVQIPNGLWYRDVTTRDGVPWYILEAILSTPHVRHFFFSNGPMCHRDEELPQEVSLPSVIPLQTFRFSAPSMYIPPRTTDLDRREVLLILERAHNSLVDLLLPGEVAPIHCMHTWDWPALTQVYLNGEYPTYKNAPPLVMALSKMPRLRYLSLYLAQPAGSEPRPIWPPSLRASYAWYSLERLTITHPHPDDQFYAHLPPCLDRLSLRCWPRYYKHHCHFKTHMDDAQVHWTSPLLSSSEMLRLLRKTNTPNLTRLELEFCADASDNQLFRHIGDSYTHLTVLRIHRYRSPGDVDAPVTDIAAALRGLTSLRLLMMHLDFRSFPDVMVLDRVERERHSPEEQLRREAQLDLTLDAAASAANVFAGALGPSLECICILVPLWGALYQWQAYRVLRDGGECTVETLNTDQPDSLFHGYSIIYDD
ncbi:hypothetical protein VTO73DRAFT_8851 [Trametes versicolor]